MDLLADPAAGLTDYIDAALSLIALVGLFGFVFVRPIYEPRFWLSVLVVWVVWTLFLYPALSDYHTDIMKDYSGVASIFLKTFEWLIKLPLLYALYLYGKPCNPAWQKVSRRCNEGLKNRNDHPGRRRALLEPAAILPF